MECATLFCELGGEIVYCAGARLFDGRDAMANRVHCARCLALQGCTFRVHQFDHAVEVA